jgi:hypothetical protein
MNQTPIKDLLTGHFLSTYNINKDHHGDNLTNDQILVLAFKKFSNDKIHMYSPMTFVNRDAYILSSYEMEFRFKTVDTKTFVFPPPITHKAIIIIIGSTNQLLIGGMKPKDFCAFIGGRIKNTNQYVIFDLEVLGYNENANRTKIVPMVVAWRNGKYYVVFYLLDGFPEHVRKTIFWENFVKLYFGPSNVNVFFTTYDARCDNICIGNVSLSSVIAAFLRYCVNVMKYDFCEVDNALRESENKIEIIKGFILSPCIGQ